MPTLRLILARSPWLYRWSTFGRHVARCGLKRPHDADFGAVRHFAARPGIFLDVGGNIGQSALSFRVFDRARPILSLEANPRNEPELRMVRRLLPRFDYLIAAAGETDGVATLRVPVYNGLQLTGEASLAPSEEHDVAQSWWLHQTGASSESVELQEVTVAVRRLDDMGLEPALVKIDVEGAEPQVLNGLVATVERCRPVFLIEDSDDVHDFVQDYFDTRAYVSLEYRPEHDAFRRPRDQSARNLYFVPDELLAHLPVLV